MAPLGSRTRTLALVLGAWTLLTWTTRVPLAWGDDALDRGEKVLATVPVLAFVVLAAVAVLAVVRRATRAGLAVTLLAGWSLAYWAVRLPLIVVNDHPVGFLAVHAVLALVAGALAAATLASLSSARSVASSG